MCLILRGFIMNRFYDCGMPVNWDNRTEISESEFDTLCANNKGWNWFIDEIDGFCCKLFPKSAGKECKGEPHTIIWIDVRN